MSHRYQRLHDNLISSLLHHVRRYTESAKEAAKDRVYACRVESNENLDKAGQVLKLFTDDRIAPTSLFRDVQAKAFTILDRQQIDFIATHITKDARFDETAFQWEYLDELARQFKLQLRPLLMAVDWTAVSGYAPLLEAVQFLQTAFRKGRPFAHYASTTFPQRFIPDSAKGYVYAPDERVLSDGYEFLVYRLLRNGLEAGDIFCRDSVRFRSFEDDLVDDQQWQTKDRLIEDTGLSILKQPIREHLARIIHEFKLCGQKRW